MELTYREERHKFLEEHLNLLDERNKTCILMNHGTIIYESDALGVKPLRELRRMSFTRKEGDQLTLIDRVIGKGALMLAQLLGIDAIYTPLTSENAIAYNRLSRIPLFYMERVPMIENRTRTEMCPIERSVLHTTDPVEGERCIEDAIAILMKNA